MKGVRLATVEDVSAMSFIHAQTWKSAYINYISDEYLNNITAEGWIPLFTRAFVLNLHAAAVFELDGKITGTVTFGRGRPMTTCTTTDITKSNNTNSSNIEKSDELEDNICSYIDERTRLESKSCCDTGEMIISENKFCSSETEGISPESSSCEEDLCVEGEIISLYVLPEYWSTKQGYQLTKFAIDRLSLQGYKSCYLWVIKENERAVNFYKNFGFISTNELTTVILAGKAVVEEKYRIYL
ncbi:MAG: GNAT family N-acetyltransferase [Ruminiclostridium sp.]